jgi:probable HAF family extracellular repeat protein
MKVKEFSFWLALCLSTFLGVWREQGAKTYKLTKSGAFLGTESYSHGIDNQGQVVGYWNTGINGIHGFLHSGTMVTELRTLGGAKSYALNPNSAGQIVGFADGPDGSGAFPYGNRGMTNLGPLGGLNSYISQRSRRGGARKRFVWWSVAKHSFNPLRIA